MVSALVSSHIHAKSPVTPSVWLNDSTQLALIRLLCAINCRDGVCIGLLTHTRKVTRDSFSLAQRLMLSSIPSPFNPQGQPSSLSYAFSVLSTAVMVFASVSPPTQVTPSVWLNDLVLNY
ncbi:hypothetical protein M422DRAFT_242491 [Sphaerobolus stellatus SS14]|nr:hypothetical protein M422DRAFT_242491 [Sphaerobolus stellatus SS14]